MDFNVTPSRYAGGKVLINAAVIGQVKTTDFPEIEEKQLRIQLRSFCVVGSGMMTCPITVYEPAALSAEIHASRLATIILQPASHARPPVIFREAIDRSSLTVKQQLCRSAIPPTANQAGHSCGN